MNQAVDVEALRASLQAEKMVSRVHLNSYLQEKAKTAKLIEALRRLLTFNEELCQDVGVSHHYPSAVVARALIAQVERDSGRTTP